MTHDARARDPRHAAAAADIVEIRGADHACVAAAGFAGALRKLLAAGDPASWPGLEEVKASRVRRVLRGVVAGPGGEAAEVHVKLYRAGRLSDRARDALRGPRGAREFRNLREARARGLPCVEALAAGAVAGAPGAYGFLITRTEAGAPLPRGALPRDRARRAGALLRRAHDRGLHARDLHAGNVLERRDGSLVLLDLTSAVIADPLSLEQRARALAYLCRELDGGVLDPAARPLVEAYGASPACLREAARQGKRLRHRGLSAFGRRALRPCRHTAVERPAHGPRWYWHRPAAGLHAAARALVEAPPPPPVKSGRRGAVHVASGLVLKERSAAAARRLFRAAYWLEFAGVPHATPVALRTFRGRGCVVAARLPGPSLAEEVRAGLGAAELRRAAGRLGRAVGRLHAHGLRNRDLKLDNLVRDAASGEVALVDLDGVHRKRAHDRRGQAADLGRLLAAFREAGAPGGAAVLRAFLRGYTRARRCLLQPSRTRHLLQLAHERAAARASTRAGVRAAAGCGEDSATSAGASSPRPPPC